MTIPPRTDCRHCHGELREVLELGPLKLNTFPRTLMEAEALPTVPITLTVCTACGLVQLDRTVPPDLLYRQYWYRSGVNESMVRELEQIVYEAGHTVTLEAGDTVLDIGANDGTLLKHYKRLWPSYDLTTVGIDPATSNWDSLSRACNVAMMDYFPTRHLRDTPGGHLKVITAIACAYDLDDPNTFVAEIQRLLHPEGLAIIQFQDLGQMLECVAYDTCCHEHLLYYSLHSLAQIASAVGLEPVKVVRTPINGGSLRVYLRHAGRFAIDPSVGRQLAVEHALGISPSQLTRDRHTSLLQFARRVELRLGDLRRLVEALQQSAALLDIYGASTKGNITLQLAGIDQTVARCAIDRAPAKAGRVTVTGIPIVTEPPADAAQVWLACIWQYRDFLLAREAGFLQRGGRIVFPLPYVEIVSQDWRDPVRVGE